MTKGVYLLDGPLCQQVRVTAVIYIADTFSDINSVLIRPRRLFNEQCGPLPCVHLVPTDSITISFAFFIDERGVTSAYAIPLMAGLKTQLIGGRLIGHHSYRKTKQKREYRSEMIEVWEYSGFQKIVQNPEFDRQLKELADR
jgi:hypothetical protein